MFTVGPNYVKYCIVYTCVYPMICHYVYSGTQLSEGLYACVYPMVCHYVYSGTQLCEGLYACAVTPRRRLWWILCLCATKSESGAASEGYE